ncbi:MAG: LuxR C-terminal-related transcriptional regulator [Actinomycetota bacterium]|nr:LuxR C-terminal-related transcriptional regulator [Actinomycetota bacterium]
MRRERLTSRLGGASQAPALTLVSAPAGFGKTTLLAEWLAGTGRTAWLSLDAGDNDPVVFWAYVVAALQTVVDPAILASSPASVEAALATLVNELDALEDDLVMVLDDYHVIESAPIHEQLGFLLEHLPPNVHLVIGSRADPPLPLARLRARGELVELRAADLRFTTDEAVAYFNETMGLDLAVDDVAALEARTEGWIAALQLAALSMHGRDDIAGFIGSFTGDDRFVVDYLAEEVLERQPEPVRDFLLRTSILKRLTGSLCDAVTDGEGGAATLDTLDRANLFLVALDDRRSWYRYHHLFADVLHARLLDAEPGMVAILHRRASGWYEQHGDRSEAIEHALQGRHFERAAELIERAAPSMRRARQETTLRRWISEVPDDLFDARPVLLLAAVGARMASGDPTGAESLMRRVESSLDPTDPSATPIVYDEEEFRRLPAQVQIYRAALALLAGDIDRTRTHAQGALARTEPSDHLGRGSASALLGLAAWTVGDLETAHDRYAGALQAFVDADYLADVLGVSLGLADIQLAQGRLGDAERTFESGLTLTRDHPGLRGAADMHVGLSEVLLERSDLQGAGDELRAGRELGEHAGLPQYPYRWRVAAARLALAEGDPAAALDLVDQAERVYNTDFSPSVRPIAALKARVHLAMGDIEAAMRWAESRGVTVNDELSYVREFEHLTLARILVARREAGALGFISRLLAAADAGGRRRSAIELLVLRSLAHDGRGDRGGSITALEGALVRAEADGYVRVFTDEGPAMTALLRTVSPHGVAGRHAKRVLTATSAGPPSAPARQHLVEPLSSRELDVLRLLRSELSGPDIARELVVSLNTVRTHTKNIYTKLDVTNRRAAVRRADELGL